MSNSDKKKGSPPASDRWNKAYPKALRCAEERLLRKCKHKASREDRPMRLGLALSGGGLRSATFALGFVQALAKKNALRSVDVMSTVSGGGYTGGLVNRLFRTGGRRDRRHSRGSAPCPKVGLTLAIKLAISVQSRKRKARNDCRPVIGAGSVIGWLRENGNYLAPSGAGDLLVGGAVVLRNWMSMHIVLFAFFLAALVLVQALRDGIFWIAYDSSVPWLRLFE